MCELHPPPAQAIKIVTLHVMVKSNRPHCRREPLYSCVHVSGILVQVRQTLLEASSKAGVSPTERVGLLVDVGISFGKLMDADKVGQSGSNPAICFEVVLDVCSASAIPSCVLCFRVVWTTPHEQQTGFRQIQSAGMTALSAYVCTATPFCWVSLPPLLHDHLEALPGGSISDRCCLLNDRLSCLGQHLYTCLFVIAGA